MHIVALSGSPAPLSRSTWLLRFALARLDGAASRADIVLVRELPPAALLGGDARAEPIARAIAQVARAELVIVATPIYKAAYSGTLKTFLDLLPADALRGKTVLPLATGGSTAHLLALDYALKPVLSALGARDILDGVFATDAQIVPAAEGGYRSFEGGYRAEPALIERLDRALAPLLPAAAPAGAALERCSA